MHRNGCQRGAPFWEGQKKYPFWGGAKEFRGGAKRVSGGAKRYFPVAKVFSVRMFDKPLNNGEWVTVKLGMELTAGKSKFTKLPLAKCTQSK
jgi:hypothetical protein